MWQLDVKSTFLNGWLDEEIYVVQPFDFVKKGNEHKVMKLRKALYSLEQASRTWNKRIDTFLLGLGFVKCVVEYGVSLKTVQLNQLIIICLYVDDLLTISSNTQILKRLNKI